LSSRYCHYGGVPQAILQLFIANTGVCFRFCGIAQPKPHCRKCICSLYKGVMQIKHTMYMTCFISSSLSRQGWRTFRCAGTKHAWSWRRVLSRARHTI